MTWKALVKLALLGTDRGYLPETAIDDLSRLGIKKDQPVARQLLQGAALVHQMQKAGFLLTNYKQPLPKVVEAEGIQKCSARSAHHLNLIIQGTYQSALEEFVFHLLENKRVFPPENLPALFETCLNNPELWEQVRPVIGQRGAWLLRLNPAWASLSDQPKPEHWKTGNRAERVTFLIQMRQQDPTNALSLLEQTWAETSLAEQKALLKTLEFGLSLSDEAFLEKLLDASRKEVREIAADLLSKLEGSGLVSRISEVLKKHIQLSDKEKIKLELPDQLSKTIQKDGIQLKSKQHFPGGQKASWLGQMIAKVPPPFWETYFKCTPEEVIGLFEKSQWHRLFQTAIISACLRFHSPAWQLALVQNWQQKQDEKTWTSADGRLILEQLSDEGFNKVVMAQIMESGPNLTENSLASYLICLGAHQWNDRLSLQLIKGFQSLIAEAEAYYWNLSHYRRILQVGAYLCNPKLFDQFKNGWHYKSPAWPRWEKEVERFMRVLRFRMEMITALKAD